VPVYSGFHPKSIIYRHIRYFSEDISENETTEHRSRIHTHICRHCQVKTRRMCTFHTSWQADVSYSHPRATPSISCYTPCVSKNAFVMILKGIGKSEKRMLFAVVSWASMLCHERRFLLSGKNRLVLLSFIMFSLCPCFTVVHYRISISSILNVMFYIANTTWCRNIFTLETEKQ